MFQRKKKLERSSLGIIFILILGLTCIWMTTLFNFVNEIPITVLDVGEKTDAIVVLTGGSKRLDEGLKLLQNDFARKLFVSGVYKGTEVRSLLNLTNQKRFGLASQVAIGNAVDTRENAKETSEWMAKNNLQSLRLVTAAYHMPRSLLEFKYYMPKIRIVPNPVYPEHVKHEKWWAFPGTAMLLISEHNKLLLAWLRQKTDFYIFEKTLKDLRNGTSG